LVPLPEHHIYLAIFTYWPEKGAKLDFEPQNSHPENQITQNLNSKS